MGLLDDAIREHLELKRRRGADPEEVAREQREALEPLPTRERGSELDEGTEEHQLEAEPALQDAALPFDDSSQVQAIGDDVAVERERAHGLSADAPQPTAIGEEAASAAETAELDMNAVFEDEQVAHAPAEHAQTPSERLTDAGPGAEEELPEPERLSFEDEPRTDSNLER